MIVRSLHGVMNNAEPINEGDYGKLTRCSGLVVLVFVLGIMAGCSGNPTDMPRLGQVSGTVTMNSQPLPYATVSFWPTSGGRTSSGITDENGFYELIYIRSTKGTKIGLNKVSVTTQSEPIYDEETGLTLIRGPQPESVPKKYRGEGSTLEYDVKPGNNIYDIGLLSD